MEFLSCPCATIQVAIDMGVGGHGTHIGQTYYTCIHLFMDPWIRSIYSMSLRRYECRMCGHGHTTSKPSIHKVLSYCLRNCLGNHDFFLNWWMKCWWMKNQWLQVEGVDCSSQHMKAFVLKVPIGFPKFPMEFQHIIIVTMWLVLVSTTCFEFQLWWGPP